MKIHFMADLQGDQENYKRIINCIRKLGHTVITEHAAVRKYEDVKKETLEETQVYVKKMQNWLQQADIVVVETTTAGISIGFEIALALQYGKQVITIYKPNLENKAYVICGVDIERLQVVTYNDDNLEASLRLALGYAQEQVKTRFTMILSPDINAYLNQISRRGSNRSEYIRHLIRQDMKKKRQK
ncbi:hypothetical protein A2160_05715 [Candidatus Beckwithbacteria bacterium RBG_13_42_9]|uniref:Nucleoside 2-deoxyribosyltransferase n=1 Tax=Candidatus Beckwithbacteria bacterium RBG_13_42_9 TaxID=1797457 RepID=A0A1F5E6G0_9BACT|nr:MAG: hypothetical protein A2160_05715 [Candidatus Beckwithbacteria bacterium RBG_13_42_9]